MAGEVDRVPISRLTEEGKSRTDDVVVREFLLTIVFNNQELVTLLCSPANLDYLAVGFLSSEGLLKSKDDIKKITVDERRGIVRVEAETENKGAGELVFKRLITSGCGRGTSLYSAADIGGGIKVESQTRISAIEVFELVAEFQHRSQIFRATGGVHSAALCDTGSILIFREDIGRHNAIDKIFGECILKDISTADRILVTSGRVSSEILLKAAKKNIPLLISKSAPTDLGVKLANDLGVTLIGFVRGKRMNVYANDWRLADHG
ncbi:MAG: formate dehydrogenase accessory sulfurtransferase FdhD [Dehalococcoidia bacterium]|nr:formate dehydrogenase accessory sulfurtransferase FdhD [Dehalococcoidia bacterium]